MADQIGLGASRRIDQANHIRHELIQRVGVNALRLVAQIIPPLIRRPNPIPSRGQGGNLLAPSIPKFGEAVQQDHQWTINGAVLNDMQADAIGLNKN